MIKTISVNADIPASRELHITLPEDVPIGPAEIVLLVSSPKADSHARTLGDLANSEFFGMWRDRSDILDGPQFARELRSRAWTRADSTFLIDTDVLVGCLRGSPEASTWLSSLRHETFEIPGIVAMELVNGIERPVGSPPDQEVLKPVQFGLARGIGLPRRTISWSPFASLQALAFPIVSWPPWQSGEVLGCTRSTSNTLRSFQAWMCSVLTRGRDFDMRPSDPYS
jgi:hypothetical protein